MVDWYTLSIILFFHTSVVDQNIFSRLEWIRSKKMICLLWKQLHTFR